MASGRPVHPLFGGGGMKTELAAAARAMNARHGGISETKAANGKASSAAAPHRTTAPTPAAPQLARPPHPLMGGAGGGGLKMALNEQIKAMGGAKPSTALSRPAAARPTAPKIPTPAPTLQDQIKAATAKRAAKAAAGTTKAPTTKPVVVKAAPAPAPAPAPSPVRPPVSAPARPTAPVPAPARPTAPSASPAPKSAPSRPTTAASPTSPPKKIVPAPKPASQPPSLVDQLAVVAAQRKERLGYDDPVDKKPEREGPRPVPASQSWMAPAEKWTSGPPPEPVAAAPTDAPSMGERTITKTVRQTKPTTGKRIVRKKIIKKADGTRQEIITVIDGETGEEIPQENATGPNKSLAESTDYTTTATTTKSVQPLEGGPATVVDTKTITTTSPTAPAYMSAPVVRKKSSSTKNDAKANEPVPASSAEAIPAPEVVPPKANWPPSAPQETPQPPASCPTKADWPPPRPEPENISSSSAPPTAPVPSTTPTIPRSKGPTKFLQSKVSTPLEGASSPGKSDANSDSKFNTGSSPPRRSAKETHRPESSPPPLEPEPLPTTEGYVTTRTTTVTKTTTFVPGKTKAGSLMKRITEPWSTSTTTVTTTNTKAGTRQEQPKRGWFGGRKK